MKNQLQIEVLDWNHAILKITKDTIRLLLPLLSGLMILPLHAEILEF